MSKADKKEPTDFIREIIAKDLASGKHDTVITRFPPEPNGYLHIGHAKAICISFGIALENKATNARCHLRFDDTNPEKEETEYVESIKNDVRWLGFDWGDNLYFASDYFDFFYACAQHLINAGLAYVDEQSPEEMKKNRGDVVTPGTPSPFRDRPAEESLTRFEEMKAGQHVDGSMVLRAKIDLSSSNMNMRDPVIYRIMHATHHNTGDQWCIYPMYDFAHPLEDAHEHITHSLCSLEFENHRPLYDWFVQNCPVPSVPRQIEFSRLNLSYTVMSKRKLLQLVEEGHVNGWGRSSPTDHLRNAPPRLSPLPPSAASVTVAVSPRSIVLPIWRSLSLKSGMSSTATAQRRMAVLDPLKVVITNWPADDHSELVEVPNNPRRQRGWHAHGSTRQGNLDRT